MIQVQEDQGVEILLMEIAHREEVVVVVPNAKVVDKETPPQSISKAIIQMVYQMRAGSKSILSLTKTEISTRAL